MSTDTPAPKMTVNDLITLIKDVRDEMINTFNAHNAESSLQLEGIACMIKNIATGSASKPTTKATSVASKTGDIEKWAKTQFVTNSDEWKTKYGIPEDIAQAAAEVAASKKKVSQSAKIEAEFNHIYTNISADIKNAIAADFNSEKGDTLDKISTDEPAAVVAKPAAKPAAGKGKGKGKAALVTEPVEEEEVEEEAEEEAEEDVEEVVVPVTVGKGKGKAAATKVATTKAVPVAAVKPAAATKAATVKPAATTKAATVTAAKPATAGKGKGKAAPAPEPVEEEEVEEEAEEEAEEEVEEEVEEVVVPVTAGKGKGKGKGKK